MTYYTYPITIEKEDGQCYAYSEDLPGVYGLGDSIEEAKDKHAGWNPALHPRMQEGWKADSGHCVRQQAARGASLRKAEEERLR